MGRSYNVKAITTPQRIRVHGVHPELGKSVYPANRVENFIIEGAEYSKVFALVVGKIILLLAKHCSGLTNKTL